jgi:transglutaminase-like putative cysteine protease
MTSGWRMRVRHHTGFRYESDVHASYNEARLTPADTATQRVTEHQIDVEPGAALMRYRDYWGTTVHAFDLNEPHRELVVSGSSVVETGTPVPPATEVSWADLHSDAVRDQWCEHLGTTLYTALDDDVRAVASQFSGAATPREAVEAVVAWIHGEMEYAAGSTTVTTTAPEALQARHGVCQDFAHLGLAIVRALGIPARYMSGYLHPGEEDAPIGATVAGESHAWFEAWLGAWMPYDPTNGLPVGPRHVVVAHGRDYGDVPPLKGLFHGGPAGDLEVKVELTRLA